MNRLHPDFLDRPLTCFSLPEEKHLAIQTTPAPAHRLSNWLLQAGIKLCQLLLGETALGLPQPQVCWRRDRMGHSFYEVYDPQSHKTHRFETATQARAWLESRYYN